MSAPTSAAPAAVDPASAAVAARRRDLRTRLVFGPLMIAVIAGVYLTDVYWTRGMLSAAVLGLAAIGGVFEYTRMLRGAGHPVASGLLMVFTVALVASALFFTGWKQLDRELYPPVLGTLLLLFPIAVHSLARDRMKQGLEEQGATLLGFVWIAWSLYLAQGLAIRHLPSVLFVIAVCKGGDIGAYFVGRALGRHKLAPHVSQGKTVEGALGSVAASCAIAVALRGPLMPPSVGLGLTATIGIGIMLNVAAQIGDLVESLLKRNCGVKDSSNLLPAHGGVLDLVDSLLFSFPAYFLLLVSLT
jgi:phosphatidate cytidylyltransferase